MEGKLKDLLTKLGYKTDEEVKRELSEKFRKELQERSKDWEERLKSLSDSERLDIIEAIVKYETDLTKMKEKIIKVLESREKPQSDDIYDTLFKEWMFEENWYWKWGMPGGYFDLHTYK